MALGRDVLNLVAGNGFAQVLQLVSLPLLTRYFEPREFGVYTLFVGVAAVVGVFGTLRYDAAIVLPRRPTVAVALSALVLRLTFIAAGVAALTATLIALYWGSGSPGLITWVFGLGIAWTLLVGGVQRIVAAWFSRERRFGHVGRMQLAFVALTLSAQVALAQGELDGASALIVGYLIGLTAAVLWYQRFVSSMWSHLFRCLSMRSRVRLAATRYSRFPKYMLPYGLSSTLRERLVHAVFGVFAGPAELGRFAMAQRLVAAPSMFLHGGIGPVLYAHASRVSRNRIGRDAAALIELAAVFLVLPFIALAFFASSLTEAVLGESWSGTGSYISILCAPYLALALTSWLDRLFDVYATQRLALMLDVFFTILLVLAVTAAAAWSGGTAAALTFSVVFTLYEMYWTAKCYISNKLHLRRLLRPIGVVLGAIIGSFGLMLTSAYMDSDLSRLVVVIVVYLVSIVAYLTAARGRRICRQIFSRVV